MDAPPGLVAVFRRVLDLRVPILVVAGLLGVAGALLAMRIPSESAIARLLVPGDPDALATTAFHRVFPEGKGPEGPAPHRATDPLPRSATCPPLRRLIGWMSVMLDFRLWRGQR